MHSHAATMSAHDMADIAASLGGQELKPGGRAVGTAPKASQTCVACHGNDGIGILPEYPNLAGQHADYIEVSLKAYRSGQRKNPVMGGMAGVLTVGDIKDLARHLEPASGPVLDGRGAQGRQVQGALILERMR
jgi:cytochrome c553